VVIRSSFFLNNVYYNNTFLNPEWGRVVEPVPRRRSPRIGVNSDRERLIAKAVELLSAEKPENPDQVISSAINAIGRSAIALGGLVPSYLSDIKDRETTVNRLIREVVLRAASPRNRRQALSAGAIQQAYLTARTTPAGQGREERTAQRTLDRQPTKTINSSPKTPFLGLPTDEGPEKPRPPADNMGVENLFWCKTEDSYGKPFTERQPAGDEDAGASGHGCYNNT
jgi:hypothetical protein